MSGRKRTDFAIDQERTRKLNLVQSISGLAGQAAAIKARLDEQLTNASRGMKAAFPQEVARAEAWLQDAAPALQPQADVSQSERQLSATESVLRSIVARGREAHLELESATGTKATALARELSRKLSEAECTYSGQRNLLELWQTAEQLSALDMEFHGIRRLVEREEFRAAEAGIATLQEEIADRATEAGKQEEQHQRMLYVVESLRQTCAELGFQELRAPTAAELARGSGPAELVVDTFDRGTMRFCIKQNSIESDADMGTAHCFEDFDMLSDLLAARFGVKTTFELEDAPQGERPIARSEAEPPQQSEQEGTWASG